MSQELPQLQARPDPSPEIRWAHALMLIFAASALAHLWCLSSRFYMDDFAEIRDNEAVLTGNFANAGTLGWTYLWYRALHLLFGFSDAGYHAFNWLLHTANAVALYGLGRDFLKGPGNGAKALFAALLFAVHPLASEIPNYARTQDMAWVTLFSLLASWSLLSFLKNGGWVKLAMCALGITGAMFSKGPGLFHALMAVGLVGAAFLSPETWRMMRRRFWWGAGFTAGLGVILGLTGTLGRLVESAKLWGEPRFIGHAYTLARVFWEFAWRSVIPKDLSADHHIAETLVSPGSNFWNIADGPAKLAALCLAGIICLGIVLFRKPASRPIAVCLLLYAGTIVFRMLYLIPEFMPEYRIYPGLPWFCLGTTIVLGGLWNSMLGKVSPRVPAFALLGLLAVLSARRSFAWHDLDSLMADVLRQYPSQVRAVWELQERDVAAGRWDAVVERQKKLWPEIAANYMETNRQLAPARELPTGHFVLCQVASIGLQARALAHLRSPAEGLEELAKLEAFMHRLGLDPKRHRIHWEYLTHARGLVLEMAGDLKGAEENLLQVETLLGARKRDLARVRQKLGSPP